MKGPGGSEGASVERLPLLSKRERERGSDSQLAGTESRMSSSDSMAAAAPPSLAATSLGHDRGSKERGAGRCARLGSDAGCELLIISALVFTKRMSPRVLCILSNDVPARRQGSPAEQTCSKTL